ncbi:DUF5050 domain-containing protein [Clostridium porci]|uniref:DUF5050 domain-containing protein n=1 Tax=Clostridium porci TaxID=2605778 RepID=A0A7X2NLJ6_9CLOT|nr:DUF5050 domain-containing protein [Clostridium porci]MSS37126.1 DUF5050 domain-containing protein [Clostridium porci]
MDSRRRRPKKKSDVKSIFLILAAAIVMIAAIYTVINVIGKIKSDYENLEFTKKEESPVIDIEVKKEEGIGWNETDRGWKYLLKKNEYAQNQWLNIDGYLYYFGDKGYMVTGELKQEGQIFTLHDTKGYLQNIQRDWNFVPESTGENLDSLVKTNAFWCFLQEQEEGNNSPFRVIQYRKAVENKIKVLGNASNPERTTKDSMKAYGDYLYFLPKVEESQLSFLDQNEYALCNKLFRMIPGSNKKELVADNVDGYLVVDNMIFYAQGGKIYTASSGTEYATGDDRYSVIIENDACYLVDEDGKPAVSETGDSITLGDRMYKIQSDGRIMSVERAQPVIDGKIFYLSGSGNHSAVSIKNQEGGKLIIKEPYGVQSYCIVDKEIYFSAYVDKDERGQWYSQIFKSSLEGENKQKVSDQFPGSIEVMYYYEDEGEIYGEYYPDFWNQAYGEVVAITLSGSIYKIEDKEVRTGRYVNGNDRLQLVMVKNGKLTAQWQDCSWSRTEGIISTLWSKGVELDASVRSLLMTEENQMEEGTRVDRGEGEGMTIEPHESSAPTQQEKTVAPIYPPMNRDPVISTEGPKGDTTASTVVPKETEDVVEIIPLG